MRIHARAVAVALAFGALLGVSVSKSALAQSSSGNRESFWQAEAGVRTTFVTDPGFDAFATDNALTQLSLGLSRTLWQRERLSLAGGVVWDYGEKSASARGQSTSLVAHRLTALLEGRYHLFPWMYGLVRVSPGAVHQAARLSDAQAIAPLVASNWAFSLDASAGAAFLLGPQAENTASPVRWWLAAEGGYGFARKSSLLLHADVGADDPRRTGDLDLGALALAGGFVRVYGSVTY